MQQDHLQHCLLLSSMENRRQKLGPKQRYLARCTSCACSQTATGHLEAPYRHLTPEKIIDEAASGA